MKLSTNTAPVTKLIGEKAAIALIAQSGFDAVDLSCFEMLFDDNCIKLSNDYKAYAAELKAVAAENQIIFNQAHAPFPSSDEEEAFTKAAYDKILRSMEFCSLIGVRNIVVHPKQHLKYRDNKAYLADLNAEFYTSLIPYCRDYNICVCMENMWQYDENRVITHSTCSTPSEFLDYLKRVDSPYIGACLDLGHANLMPEDIPAFITKLSPYLKALHVHETGFNRDKHTLPFMLGTMKWDPILKALADCGYAGDFTFEAENFINYLPKELLQDGMIFMAKVGRELIRRYQVFAAHEEL